ncbi:MAG: 2-(1,2-epoxy-1,2-dihydrophenyl)acetyl-CoA isomerase [Candidatus Lokiarchaeota archaeon]|nr:2-(1,2-epoxy-1,2-dihydrophenyl)acetyl-CoA isomerase [Candidatus Lokiarchaeota archaeon]
MKLDTVELELFEENMYAILYLNRPDNLNALNTQMADDITTALQESSKQSRTIRSLIIMGKGKAFSAGGDLAEFKRSDDPDFLYKLAGKFHGAIKLLKHLNAPSIAAVNGACYGVGLSLASACDLRICSQSARFSVAFTNVGLSPDSSLTFHLPKIVGLSMANEMVLLNKTLTANEAKKTHLVSEITSDDQLLERGKELAIQISNGPTIAYGSTKRLFFHSYSNRLNEHLEDELKNLKLTSSSIDFQEGMNAFLEKRKPNFQGK